MLIYAESGVSDVVAHLVFNPSQFTGYCPLNGHN